MTQSGGSRQRSEDLGFVVCLSVLSMKHLLRQQFRSFFWNLPCRRSFVHFPEIISSPELSNDTLKRRIERVQDSTVSITPLLREWCERGNQIRHTELKSIISSLHRSKRFFQALQVRDFKNKQIGILSNC